jgi:hypothetical protein
MPNPNFPGPSINRLLDSSPKIVRVAMDTAEWGARKSAQPKSVKNDMTLSHVSQKG